METFFTFSLIMVYSLSSLNGAPNFYGGMVGYRQGSDSSKIIVYERVALNSTTFNCKISDYGTLKTIDSNVLLRHDANETGSGVGTLINEDTTNATCVFDNAQEGVGIFEKNLEVDISSLSADASLIYRIGFEGSSYMKNIQAGVTADYKVYAKANLNVRADTSAINSSPVIFDRASMGDGVKMKRNCANAYFIPVNDPEGDAINCRAITESWECDVKGDCASLSQIKVTTEAGGCLISNEDVPDVNRYVVAIQIEDFYPGITDEPFSTTAIKFVADIVDELCYNISYTNTQRDGECINLNQGGIYTNSVYASTKNDAYPMSLLVHSISDGYTMSHTPFQELDMAAALSAGLTNEHWHLTNYTINAADTATGGQFCFRSMSTDNVISEKRCITIENDIAVPNITTDVVGHTPAGISRINLHIEYNNEIKINNATESKYLTIKGDILDNHQVKSTSEVTIAPDSKGFIVGNLIVLTGVPYFIEIDAGFVLGGLCKTFPSIEVRGSDSLSFCEPIPELTFKDIIITRRSSDDPSSETTILTIALSFYYEVEAGVSGDGGFVIYSSLGSQQYDFSNFTKSFNDDKILALDVTVQKGITYNYNITERFIQTSSAKYCGNPVQSPAITEKISCMPMTELEFKDLNIMTKSVSSESSETTTLTLTLSFYHEVELGGGGGLLISSPLENQQFNFSHFTKSNTDKKSFSLDFTVSKGIQYTFFITEGFIQTYSFNCCFDPLLSPARSGFFHFEKRSKADSIESKYVIAIISGILILLTMLFLIAFFLKKRYQNQ